MGQAVWIEKQLYIVSVVLVGCPGGFVERGRGRGGMDSKGRVGVG